MILLLKVCKVNEFMQKISEIFLQSRNADRAVLRTANLRKGVLGHGICPRVRSILFDYLDFQIVKFDFFYEIILGKVRLAVTLKVGNGSFQPDGLTQIELQTDFFQSVEYFVRAGIVTVILYDNIL